MRANDVCTKMTMRRYLLDNVNAKYPDADVNAS